MRAAAVLLALMVGGGATAQEGAGGRSSDYDFFVLSLSWSPSYCEAEGSAADPEQCGGDVGLGFIVHGLWPQYETGYPDYCRTSEPGPDGTDLDAIFDVIPSHELAAHQWEKHGTCTGLDGRGYFALTRAAAARVVLPPGFLAVASHTLVAPGAVENAFIAANPGLPAAGIAVTCDARRIREVRVCLTPELGFRACPEVDADACGRASAALPPLR